jgi:hypothetical protein
MRSRLPISPAVVAALAVTACGAPTLSHFGGYPFEPVGEFVQLDRGWIAVDSCAGGVHALVELDLEASSTGRMPRSALDLALWPRSGRLSLPTHLVLEGPFCWPGEDQPLALESRHVSADEAGYRPGQDPECKYFYVVRAEFSLPRMPPQGEYFSLALGQQRIALRWEP